MSPGDDAGVSAEVDERAQSGLDQRDSSDHPEEELIARVEGTRRTRASATRPPAVASAKTRPNAGQGVVVIIVPTTTASAAHCLGQ